jgi:O-antigen ligase
VQAPANQQAVVFRFSRAALYISVALAPLPFGSVEPLWLSIWIVLLALALALADHRRLRPVHLALLAPMLIAALVYGGVVALQSAAIPGLLPDYPLYARIQPLLGGALREAVPTATREAPFWAIGPAVAALLAFLAGFVNGTDREAAARLMRVVAWAALAYAVYGVLMMVVDPRALLWREKIAYVGRLTGPFVNANTAATFFGMGTVIWAALLSARVRSHLPDDAGDFKDALKLGLSRLPQELIGLAIAFLITFCALLATGSRAGSLVTVVAVGLVIALSFRKELSTSFVSLSAVAGVGAVGLLLLELLGGGLGQRIQDAGLVDLSRLDIYRASLAIVSDFPWWGTGLGTFAEVFPAYRSGDWIWGVLDRAHNTVLEVAVELGIPVASTLALAALVTLACIFRGALTRHRDRALPIIGAGVGTLAFLHSTVDFHLQTPGFALPFWAVLGAALAQSVSSLGKDRGNGTSGTSTAGRAPGPAERALPANGPPLPR